MASIVTEDASAPGVGTDITRPDAWIDVPVVPEVSVPEADLPPHLLAVLDDPSLVLSEGYIGPDRRLGGFWARVHRVTFPSRRSLLRLEALVFALVVVVVLGAVALVRSEPSTPVATAAGRTGAVPTIPTPTSAPAPHPAPTLTPPSTASAPSTTAPAAVVPTTTPPTTTTPAVAAAFSNYWSPGVGDWSDLAPLPTGATLTAVEPWLNPTIP